MRGLGWLALALAVGGSSLGLACSGSNKNSGFDPNDPNNGSSSGSSGGNGFGGGADGGKPGAVCAPNAANYDVPGNNCDDDADGTVDNPPACDDGLAANGSAEDFAKAIGICTKASDKGYGLVSASITRGFGATQDANAEQHGILPKFGAAIKPREGKSLGILSTGYAEDYDGSSGTAFGGEELQNARIKQWGKDWKVTGKLPAGFPKAAQGCQQGKEIHDPIDVKLTVKAPPNASGVKFDLNFYTGEWPAYVCSQFNDGFIAYLSAKGFNNGTPDNVSFDKDKNPISVNNGFFDRCTPNVAIGCAKDPLTGQPGAKPGTSKCPGGTAELEGTGFGIVKNWCAVYSVDPFSGDITDPGQPSTNGGATGWLTSQAPIQAGETFTIEFILWDTGDGVFDSSILIDNFTYAAGEVTTGTERPN